MPTGSTADLPDGTPHHPPDDPAAVRAGDGAAGSVSSAAESVALRPITELPAAVRQRIIEWAAAALSGAAPTEIPGSLTRVARFAPSKRARAAAPALGQAVQTDSAFRALVAERIAQPPADGGDNQTDNQADNQTDDAAADPVGAAARAYLLRLPDEQQLLEEVAAAAENIGARTRVLELERDVRRLTAQLERAQRRLAERDTPAPPGDGGEADRLRLRLREQGNRIKDLQQQVDDGAARAAELVAQATADRDRAVADAEAARQRAEAATTRADAAAQGLQRLRDSAGDRRATSDRRLELLLGALEGAASGLRREWDLIGGGPAPADVVAAGLPQPAPDGERTGDPSRLTAWLGVPGVHMIVDGYNVTKTGFPELSLSDQRDRLVRSLGALSARTSAEITVVFDGAAVTTARPRARGVRVLFSAPGVLADTVIGDLVRAEPVGRVVVVVTSDRAVADRAAVDGARSAASVTLLAVIGG